MTADRLGWHQARGDLSRDVRTRLGGQLEAFPHTYGPLNVDAVVAVGRYDPQRHQPVLFALAFPTAIGISSRAEP